MIGTYSCFLTLFYARTLPNFASICWTGFLMFLDKTLFPLYSPQDPNQLEYKIGLTNSDALSHRHQIYASSGCTSHTLYILFSQKTFQPNRFTDFWVYVKQVFFTHSQYSLYPPNYEHFQISAWSEVILRISAYKCIHNMLGTISILPAHDVHLLIQQN
jgi:hypothetical protein